VVTQVIGVAAVRHPRDAPLSGQCLQLAEELVFAEVAALRRVLHVARPLHLLRLDGLVADAELKGQPAGLIELRGGHGGRNGGDGQGGVVQDVVSHRRQERAVDTSGEGDQHRAHVAEDALQPGQLALQFRTAHQTSFRCARL
jgi:hypothetical protein